MFDKYFCDIIKKVTTFNELCDNLNGVTENKTLGTYFEWFAKLILKHDSRYSNFVSKCWTLDKLPEKIRQFLEIPVNDIGIDLVVKTHDGDYYAVQVKYRKNIKCIINWDNLSTFFGLTFGLSNKFKKGIFFTNTLNPNKYIKNHSNIICILNHSLRDVSENTFTKIKNIVFKTTTELKISYTPKPYQTSIIKKSHKYYKEHNKGRLYMPCGTGKTLVCYWITAKLNDNKRICIVVPSLYLLSQMYNTWVELKLCKYLLIGSDAEVKTCDDTGLLLSTDKNDIEQYLTKHVNDELVIITTYQSSEVLSEACKKLRIDLDIIIYDEAHKTVGSSDRSFSCLLNDDNITTKKRLFTTATEKIYSGNDDDIISMDDVTVYGDIIYSYSFKNAIENRQLCDYQIITPLINDDGFWSVVKRNKFIIDKSIQKDPIESRYYMTVYLLCRSIREHKLTHILTFNNSNANAKRTYQILEQMLEQMNIECNCYHLTGESSMNKRQKVVEDFIKDKCAIISSARIFQEGINIPIVDCVCFMDNKLAVIDIIQSVGRVLRLCEGKEKGYILIPTLVNFEETDDSVFDVNPSDFGTVKSIVKAIGTIDDRIIDEFVTKDKKQICGGNQKFTTDIKDVIVTRNIKISLDELVDKVCTIVCDRWGTVNWFQMLEKVKKYIDENKKRPNTYCSIENINVMGKWLCLQTQNYKKMRYNMKNKVIKKQWEHFIQTYSVYFRTNEDEWKYNLSQLGEFIKKYNKLPTKISIDQHEKFLGIWLCSQKQIYKKKLQIMGDEKIRNIWKEFIVDHNNMLSDKIDMWKMKLNDVKDYIHINHEIPRPSDKNKKIKSLGTWLSMQLYNFDNKYYLMKTKLIYDEMEQFVTIYQKYLIKKTDKWPEKMKELEEYITTNKKIPHYIKDFKLHQWYYDQMKYYKKKQHGMKDINRYDIWTKFTEKYKEYID
jgi:predicted helicase